MAEGDDITDIVEQFMAVTGVEDTVAMCYLQKSGWNLQAAVNNFCDSSDCMQGNKNNPIVVIDGEILCDEGPSMETEDMNPNLTVLSWNVDGLDGRNILERTRKVCHTINSRKPDIVFLQEVIKDTLSIYQSKCPGYTCKYGPTHAYFNIILLKNSSVQLTNELQCTHFQSSKMGRHLLCQSVLFKNKTEVILMTSHLESTAKCKPERIRQLQQVLASISDQPEQATVVFGGDTNLRDTEVMSIGGLPNGMLDAWDFCGRPKDAEFTWDTKFNDNLDWPYPKASRIRFDRFFIRPGEGENKLNPSCFELVGLERLPGCRRFASDHWGIWCEFTQAAHGASYV
ncbi:tyrosyl-DNA phosphodiesterase 2-like [Montipora foliosa]|uniref:tyrosyl-DNA phosphodiesterase 2-like n=1 Tax=Montipora foliosa TaxID=591990 RepID=UPI0035F1241C